MKDFSKATPRPWHLKGKVICANIQAGSVSIETPITDVCYTGAERWREEEELNAELIVTAVNNFNKMKETIIKANNKLAYLYGYNLGKDAVSDVPDMLDEIQQLLESLK